MSKSNQSNSWFLIHKYVGMQQNTHIFNGHFSATICPCRWWGELRKTKQKKNVLCFNCCCAKCQVMTDDKHIFLFRPCLFASSIVSRFKIWAISCVDFSVVYDVQRMYTSVSIYLRIETDECILPVWRQFYCQKKKKEKRRRHFTFFPFLSFLSKRIIFHLSR